VSQIFVESPVIVVVVLFKILNNHQDIEAYSEDHQVLQATSIQGLSFCIGHPYS
jgi:hypothetical protein